MGGIPPDLDNRREWVRQARQCFHPFGFRSRLPLDSRVGACRTDSTRFAPLLVKQEWNAPIESSIMAVAATGLAGIPADLTNPALDPKEPFVTFALGEEVYALSTRFVQEMVSLPEIVPEPGMPPHQRGIVNLRGAVIPVIDLRVRLGLPSARVHAAQFQSRLEQRRTEHLAWIGALRNAVSSGEPFQGELDPGRCALGRWLNETQGESDSLRSQLLKFRDPHQRLHQAGAAINCAIEAGNLDKTQSLLQDAEEEMAKIGMLFDQTIAAVEAAQRELLVVLRLAGRKSSITVDGVRAVERIPEDHFEKCPMGQDPLIGGLARIGNNGIACVIDPERL